ncbi:MAG TPA: hypothetical protein VHX52_13995 [Steroidobacteraceae bacterium]|jgi:carboxypeptidase C (cathepsin A)|nr:hypothetical protein [Steroidobacteraceae bacterium]
MRRGRSSTAAAAAAALAALMSALLIAFLIEAASPGAVAVAAAAAAADTGAADRGQGHEAVPRHFIAGQQRSTGSVTVAGSRIDYVAYAGTLVVHPKGWDDVAQNAPPDEGKNPQPEASMFYVAYFKLPEAGRPGGRDRAGHRPAAAAAAAAGTAGEDLADVGSPARPITFLFNGGPGSSTVWLHMGAFGPWRVLTADDMHTPAAPYRLVNNDDSLLDASNLVFVDAPGTGFSRIAGKDRQKAFYGVDQDAWAFSDFIVQFLSRYGRWNSPKYLFGESYGTTRAAVLAGMLETERYVDLNGVILLSQILNYDDSADAPQLNPGIELPYELALPTYAATAWYHHELPGPARELLPLLQEVEQFAMNDYARALAQGAALPQAQRAQIAQQLHQYTGLPVDYILKADLRINAGEFEKNLQGADLTTGRLDTRFSGPTLDPLSEEAEYDPQTAAIGSAYVSSFNDYVRTQLHYGQGQLYKPEIDTASWNFQHQPPGADMPLQQAPNVLPDLQTALKYDPQLHVLLNAGYFDLATPFYEGVYEMQQLQLPPPVRANVEFAFYQSGHMVYVHEPALKQLHANVAAFIRRTAGGHGSTAASAARN